MEALGPRMLPGLAEVPSSRAVVGLAPLINVALGVADDFAFFSVGGGITTFPFDFASLGKMSDASFVGRFSRITTPFEARVDFADVLTPLDSSTF